ncbi:hypothetical protein [Saccharopolyspora flava]|uniref:Mce-associated membrane protein n=1 Tax=Saccharopolyspora flava TaxID=95161 RepID=A0A1I6SBU7_9PSEU|nr:hypothetical protein [Saccharopolyspora flava]SFS74426.1 Mce-associated membrane protein [Saccharopolyspora flava]
MTDTATRAEPEQRRAVLKSLRAPRVLVTAVIAVLLLGALAWTGLQLREHLAVESARADAQEAAKRYATDLSTYDYRHLDSGFATVTAHAEGQFAEQYKQVSASLTELIRQNQAVSQGTVLTTAVVSADEDHAVVALFVDQKITNKNTPEPRVDRNRMQMTLTHDNNRWLITNIQLL